jgi:ABC-type multidrug transport system ATPase subunit
MSSTSTDDVAIKVAALESALDSGASQNTKQVSLSWNNVQYNIPVGKAAKGEAQPMRTILDGLTGAAPPSKLLAIMGPSGGGKTSLLNVLAGRIPLNAGADLAGSVLVNGSPVSGAVMASFSAYVEQDGTLFALSTVHETLSFAAQLRMPAAMSQEAKNQRVESIIAELGLVEARDTLIGNERIRGVSGGERKRVSVGCCMIHDPQLIFLDEPTSGLDSFQALNVMTTLKDLCQRGRTVVCSIHQPRSSIYAMVDNLVLLSQGQGVYFGQSGKPCSDYFGRLGYPVPADFNPADHFLDVISVDQRTEELEQQTKGRLGALVQSFAAEAVAARKSAALRGGGAGGGRGGVGDAPLAVEERLQPRTFWPTFCLLLKRNWREQTRDMTALFMKYFLGVFFSVVFGLVYFQMGRGQVSIQDRTGILFFMAMNQAFGSSIGTSQVIPLQLKVVNRERAARLYEVLPFYCAAFCVNLPLELVPQLMNGAVVYFMAGLRPGAEAFVTFAGILALENFVGIGLGMVLSASLKSVEMAPQVAPAVVVLFLMFSGFFLNDNSVPVYLSWMKYISFIRYAFIAMSINELRGQKYDCDSPAMATVNATGFTEFSPGPCLDGDQVLERLGFADQTVLENCAYLGVLLVSFNLIAYYVLVKRQPRFLAMRAKKDD